MVDEQGKTTREEAVAMGIIPDETTQPYTDADVVERLQALRDRIHEVNTEHPPQSIHNADVVLHHFDAHTPQEAQQQLDRYRRDVQVADDVRREVMRSRDKHGDQGGRPISSDELYPLYALAAFLPTEGADRPLGLAYAGAHHLEEAAKALVEHRTGSGDLTWIDVLLEEVFELRLAADSVENRGAFGDPLYTQADRDAIYREAVQVAAVAVKIAEVIRRG